MFRTIFDSTNIAHFVTDGQRLLFANPAFELLTGYGIDEFESINVSDFFSYALPHLTDAMATSKTCSATRIRFETSITTRGGEKRWVSVSGASFEHAHGPALFLTAFDITDFRHREDVLRRSEQKYKTIFDFAPDLIVVYNPEGVVLDMSPIGAQMHARSREEIIGKYGVSESWTEKDLARFEEIRNATLRDGEWHGELTGIFVKDGPEATIETRAKVGDIEGEKIVIVISRDITERKRMEEEIRGGLREKETLLREIHHRVKNNMQIISSLLRLQSKNAKDDKTRSLFRESQNRILSMAMIHEKLYQSEGLHKINIREYIADLVGEVFSSFGEKSDSIALLMEIEDIVLGLDTAIPCGLIIIELVSNSLKYAFPEGGPGEVFIGLRSEDQGRFRLTVSDNGPGLPENINIDGLQSLGLRLVSDLAKYQLEGEMAVSSKKGTSIDVSFKEREKVSKASN